MNENLEDLVKLSVEFNRGLCPMDAERVIAHIVCDLYDIKTNLYFANFHAENLWDDKNEEERSQVELQVNALSKLADNIQKHLSILKEIFERRENDEKSY